MRTLPSYRGATARVCLGALTLTAALAGCDAPVPTSSPSRPAAAAAAGAGAVSFSPSVPRLDRRWVVNALYIALLDDDTPPRFTSPQIGNMCGPDTRVFADGRNVTEGQPIPGPVFTLRWEIDGCQPLGDAGPLLAGSYEVLVMHDDEHGPGAMLLRHNPLFLAQPAPLQTVQRP